MDTDYWTISSRLTKQILANGVLQEEQAYTFFLKCIRKYWTSFTIYMWIYWEWWTDVAIFGSIITLSDMEYYACAFIRHLVIEFAKTGKTLNLPKIECFPVQMFPHSASFGLAWGYQLLAMKHTSRGYWLMMKTILYHRAHTWHNYFGKIHYANNFMIKGCQ